MEGAFLLDAGMPEYAAHLTKMTTLAMKLLPTAAGIAFDGAVHLPTTYTPASTTVLCTDTC